MQWRSFSIVHSESDMAEASGSAKRSSTPTFKPEWDDIFFSETEGGAKCLICNKILNQRKKFNLKRHYTVCHSKQYDEYTDEMRTALIKQLKEMPALNQEDEPETTHYEPALRLSYRICLLLANTLKSFADGDIIKECLVMSAEEFCPNLLSQYKSVCLSPRTVIRRIQDLSQDLTNQLAGRCCDFIAFSLALDESTDVCGTAQLAIFIRGVNKDLEITEELLDVIPMKDTTTGADIIACLEESVENFTLPWELLVSVATDGAPAMVGPKNGLVGRLKQKLNDHNLDIQCIFIHCILHQENLCAKTLKFVNVMGVVIKTVNFIRQCNLNHRQFRTLLEDIECHYGDIPYHCEVRWLSKGKVLDRFFELREEIAMFMDMKDKAVPELKDSKWICDLAFLADLTSHLSTLNVSLQGKRQIITQMWDKVKAFKMKLQLWERQLANNNISHFSKLASLLQVDVQHDFKEYADILAILHEQFETRFQDLTILETQFDIFAIPFSVNVDSLPANLQLEIIDLQCDRELKDKFNNKQDLAGFYQSFPHLRFPRLHNHAAKILCMFGTTYMCEQLFSVLKLRKHGQQSNLSDENLNAILRIKAAQNITPNIDRLVKAKLRNKK